MKPYAIVLAALLALPLTGCKERGPAAGKYQTDAGPGRPKISLTLEKGGQGTWTSPEDTVNFRWEQNGSRILLHTKNGGVLTGDAAGSAITVHLPDSRDLQFKRSD